MIERLERLEEQITQACAKGGRKREEVRLVAVSKGQEKERILELYEEGVKDFGENRVAEVLGKQLLLPKDINWHFIGTLQLNKVRKALSFSHPLRFCLIHSVDSLELARKIHEVAQEADQNQKYRQDVLIQVNISKEATKHGLSSDALLHEFHEFLLLENIRVCGLMTMAPKFLSRSDDELFQAKTAFSDLRKLRDKLLSLYPETKSYFKELSMGMSQDFELAIEEGATIIRIGSLLF